MSRYEPRPVTSYGVETISGWPVKIYGLAVSGRPSDELVMTARERAGLVLAAAGPARAAFVIAHQARPACFVLVYWWSTPVDLSLRYFRAPLDEPTSLEPLPATSVGCIWELALTNHERLAWMSHMLRDGSDLDGYLSQAGPDHV